ncbi:hypothetical protein VTN00DRAFT_5286 [Thermoascus crustaceus]|uniref:uncharacterized protein n=1 Tax=Thermoascus crustaceus TaxID=5088 RepID=UPI003742DB32
MPNAIKLLLATLALAAPIAAQQAVQAVWSRGGFETISGPAGNEMGHSSGFTILDQDGNEIYSNAYPGDYAPCQMNGHTFTLSGGCFSAPFKFACTSKFDGNPKNCEVLDSSGNSLGKADGNTKTNFNGISISEDGTCSVGFTLGPNDHCGPNTSGFNVS